MAEFDRSGEEALSTELAASLIQLLASAQRQLEADREKAKASIAHAASLLQVEFDRRNALAGDPQGVLIAWQVTRLRAYIDTHLETWIQVRDLAAVAHRSTTYFRRAFKATFGEAPHTFIVGRRLGRAAQLMLTSDISLSQIAAACGFADQAHFSKMFKQRHGETPAAWRRQRREVS